MILILFTGCSETETHGPNNSKKISESLNKNTTENEYSINYSGPISFEVNEQEFQIIPVLNPILEYIQEVEKSDEDYKGLFRSMVVEPFREEAFGKDGGLWLRDRYSFEAPRNSEQLQESIKTLDQDFEHLSLLIKETIEKSANLLPGGNTKIYIFPFNPDQFNSIRQMSGVTAFGTSNQIIVMHIAPHHYDEDMLKYATAHEYHHIVHFEKNENRDLFDYVLSEGKADSFANIMIPHFEAP
ncbi:DUF2268 domain-containing putative Zn-dependent protease [Allobacillus sp. GCM10007491]|uniref:DUF2268 domain-containing protein n=1 Tax=Allobacillus saliphilus TaxID=2912308 RepID=A0A941HUL6_9BACI|nr:DUF2268 domain-containing putative Zn-dependent protease [Allobacillus saliphilus]MBR7554514.1 hypothetical protein [Allobacillus saliphilus]